ncbi:15-hydroxyprostaglandin dehydrogenase [NAD(+)]-like [Bombyx mandarina]|uniref:15-hydroxyprostaglandin dehydrogenase [NAD(+)] n=1 Tax=Bombyx mandarina TaxID=7092 RepID=A0A6J2JLS0_BOMMA|nr:15-hydroxyprostaglandin dehydrogenase [NAD(+)]-like [Bombyx mandarina]
MAPDFVKRFVDVDDKVFLVTGGAAGVGAGLVKALLFENARHVAFLDVADREGAALEAQLIIKFGALRVKFIKCDVGDERQLASAYKQVLDKYKRLDGVINSAAVLSIDDNSFNRMIDINFTGTVNSTLKALDIMGADKGGSGGVIVNISSLLALNLTSHLPVYAATKAAVLQFSIRMGTQEQFTRTKVRVLSVCLGPTDTAILYKNNLTKFDAEYAPCLSSRAPVRQRVESAVKGILEVINKASTGDTWIVESDKPAYDFTQNISEAFQILSKT